MDGRKWYLEPNDFLVEHWVTEDGEGVIVLRVVKSFVRPFDYGLHMVEGTPMSLSPQSGSTMKFQGTFGLVRIDDLTHYTDVKSRLHLLIKTFPPLRLYPYFPAGYLQTDLQIGNESILAAEEGADWGYLETPIDIIVPPKIRMQFHFYNPYGTETVKPLFKLYIGSYVVEYVKDVDVIYAILRKKYKPEPRWFTLYGFKKFRYPFKELLGITKPIPLDAEPDEISEIVREWEV